MPGYRELAAGQSSQVFVAGPASDGPDLLWETSDLLVEAPNWSLDSRTLYLNGNGRLWSLDVEDPELREVEFQHLPEINNDHVLSPDGVSVFMSAADGHVYRGALTGGPVQRVSPQDGEWHFLHGVSPDGAELAWVQLKDFDQPGRLVVGPSSGTGPTRVVDTGRGHVDGPEWSPDASWLYFNTEGFTTTPGHAQLARVPATGGNPERLVESGTVDWFPHLSPDARHAAYITFPPGTLGHPADLDVRVRVVETSDWTTPVQDYPLFGGQGTINVNSWAPTSDRFAFVAYPVQGRA